MINFVIFTGAVTCGNGESVTFELVTGAIFTSEKGKISSFQTFDLAECTAACRKNGICASANFETGLCTTSQFNASTAPDNLRTDDFPVFPNYMEKLCLSKRCQFIVRKMKQKIAE